VTEHTHRHLRPQVDPDICGLDQSSAHGHPLTSPSASHLNSFSLSFSSHVSAKVHETEIQNGVHQMANELGILRKRVFFHPCSSILFPSCYCHDDHHSISPHLSSSLYASCHHAPRCRWPPSTARSYSHHNLFFVCLSLPPLACAHVSTCYHVPVFVWMDQTMSRRG
jgi:hypothetical protein